MERSGFGVPLTAREGAHACVSFCRQSRRILIKRSFGLSRFQRILRTLEEMQYRHDCRRAVHEQESEGARQFKQGAGSVGSSCAALEKISKSHANKQNSVHGLTVEIQGRYEV